ncbi:MAG: helix-turn-helix transcriptional regulator [Pyrinomonadaceae bacterium]
MSHRGDLTERLALIPVLLTERPRTQRELAEQFSVNPKTIRRNVDELSRHHPIVVERKGREVKYGFSNNYRYRSPTFTPGELGTLLLAQESIAATGLTGIGTPFASYGQSLLQKVRESLPPSLRQTLDMLGSVIGSATVPAKDFSAFADIIERLTQAAARRRRVRMRYYTLHRNAMTERVVDPYVIYFDPDGATLKLIGYDNFRSRITPFAIDHIRWLRETDDRFKRPANFNLREYLTENCFNGIHGDPLTVRLRAYGVTARIFAERTFHPSQRIIERTGSAGIMPASEPGATGLKANSRVRGHTVSRMTARPLPGSGSPAPGTHEESTTIEMRVAGGRGLLRFILGWGDQVEVLAPESLRQEVAEAHQGALGRYGIKN